MSALGAGLASSELVSLKGYSVLVVSLNELWSMSCDGIDAREQFAIPDKYLIRFRS